MVQYCLYVSGVSATANITLTGKGKIVGILLLTQALGGAAAAMNNVVVSRNQVPTLALNVAVNGPQKQQNLAILGITTAITTYETRNQYIEGLAIDYSPGDLVYVGNFNANGTNPTTWITNVILYCIE